VGIIEEPRVKFPEPLQPVLVTRNLTLARDKKDPLLIEGVELIVLVNRCLYLVTEDGHGLRSGQVLARNLDLTQRRGGSSELPETEQFIAFKTLNTARRGVSKIDPGRKVEHADLAKWLKDLDWMVRTSWTLHLADEEEEAQYVAVAETAASDHKRVRNTKKVKAVAQTDKASSPIDSIGRKNTGRLPLTCFAGERKLRERVMQMRGIGYRMSWREVVLMHYIDRMREITRQIRIDAQHRFQSPYLFGAKRTRRTVMTEADRMVQEAEILKSLVGRPFDRNFQHVAKELIESAAQMRDAAHGLDGKLMKPVQSLLRKIYRSARILEFHWDLEELLVQMSILRAGRRELSEAQKKNWYYDLRRIHKRLTRPDPVTNERWEEGFSRRVLPHVFPQVHLASVHLMQPIEKGGPDIEGAYARIKEACRPL